MKHKIFISWVIALISTLFLTLIIWFAFGINLVLAIMVPIDIGVSATVIPIVLIDQRLELKDKIEKKSKKYKISQGKGQKYEKTNNKKVKKKTKRRRDDRSDIQILGEEEIAEDSIQVLVGDIKVLDIPQNKSQKTSIEIMKEHFDNKILLDIFEKKDSLDEIIKSLDKFELTSFSKEFFDKMDEFEWSDEQKLEFINDMIVFSPQERMEILSNMTENSIVDK